MRYFHIRKNGNELVATVAVDSTGPTARYGVSVVSGTEPRGRVSYAVGRAIAMTRVGRGLPWKEFYTKETQNDVISAIRNEGLEKAGMMTTDALITSIKGVRRAMNDTYIANKAKKAKAKEEAETTA